MRGGEPTASKKAAAASKKTATASKKTAASATGKVHYTFEPLDTDGDGVPDGDLVTKYVDGKVEGRPKFVPLDTMKKKIDEVNQNAPHMATGPRVAVSGQNQDVNSPVQIADQTSFGQYVKQGAGTALGAIATTTVFNALGSIFDGEE
jgi:hypothetical protein